MALSPLHGRLCIVIAAVVILLFMPLTFSGNNNNNTALAQTPHCDAFNNPTNYDVGWCLYEMAVENYPNCIASVADYNRRVGSWGGWEVLGIAFVPLDVQDLCRLPAPPPPIQPLTCIMLNTCFRTPQPPSQDPCIQRGGTILSGICVPNSCASGQRNGDGSCVPPPCTPTVSEAGKDPRVQKIPGIKKLYDPRVNPEFRFHLENALKAALDEGFKFHDITEVYRDPGRSDKLNARGIQAAAGYGSTHNYGLGVDLNLADEQGHELSGGNKATGKDLYDQLRPIMEKEGLVRGPDKDNGHYEYTPNWRGKEGGWVGRDILVPERDKAIREAAANGLSTSLPYSPDWIRIMWRNAGAPCLP